MTGCSVHGRAPDELTHDGHCTECLDELLETAIARRNTTWAEAQAAFVLLESARKHTEGDDALRPFIRNANRARDGFEWACRDLARRRVANQFARGQHWSQQATPIGS